MPRMYFILKAHNAFTGKPIYVSDTLPSFAAQAMTLNVSQKHYDLFLSNKTKSGSVLYVTRHWTPTGIQTGLFATVKEAITAALRNARKWTHNAPTEKEMLSYAKQVVANPDEAVTLSQTRGSTVPGTTALDDSFITVVKVRCLQ